MRTMTAPRHARTPVPADGTPVLVNGDRLDQPEFHRRYQRCPEGVTFELVGGVVFMASPLSLSHSDYDGKLGLVLELYMAATPGVQALHNATAILGPQSEPQPDLGLRILPEWGGQSRTKEGYVEGAPELVAEIAHSRRAIDLHAKRDDYRKAGVLEYVVVVVETRELLWYHFPDASERVPDKNGIVRSKAFPGLWVHAGGLLGLDSVRLRGVMEQGLASRPHAAFVRKLQRGMQGPS